VVQRLGGRFETSFFTFGKYDLMSVIEMPADVDAAAFAMAAAAGGAIKAVKTTPLMTVEEGLETARKAAACGYQAPAAAAGV
jgi:uncharacterized protein with GYD domain